MKPILVERYADNGQLSHYELIDDEGNVLWTQSDESPSPSFQLRVNEWMQKCFGEEISKDIMERNHRFIEEALELVQSTGITKSEVVQLVDYVFDRPIGETNQEIGGVMVTLAALCLAINHDMAAAGETELSLVWTKIDKIRQKQANKPKHSPLPQCQMKDVHTGLQTAIDDLENCLDNAPVDFLGTGSDGKAAQKEEEKWYKKWRGAIAYLKKSFSENKTLPSPSLQEAAEAMKKSLRPPDAEWVKNDLVHNGMHMWSLFPAHAFAILMAEFIADNNYEYDWHSHNTEFTMWNEVEDPQLHGEDGPEIITTNQLFIKFEKWVKEKYPEFISSFIAGWNAREAQQTGPLLLTRELHDKIWEAAISWKMEQIIISEFSEDPIYPEKNPDKETFWKSLNI